MASCVEYDEKENDLRTIMCSRKCLKELSQTYNLNPNILNINLTKIGFQNSESNNFSSIFRNIIVSWWGERFKQLRNTNQSVRLENTLTMPTTNEKRIIQTVVRYIGESEYGKPRYFQTVTGFYHLSQQFLR